MELDSGEVLEANIILVGIGVLPNTELAASAGLPVGDGIIVDDKLLTSDPSISAIGDCALHPNRFCSRPIRLESVQNACDQARIVAARLVGDTRSYKAVPWFWSDQGEHKLQISGLTANADNRVIRGDPASGQFSIFCFDEQRFLGVESVNRPADHMIARQLLATGATVIPAHAADPTVNLKGLIPRQIQHRREMFLKNERPANRLIRAQCIESLPWPLLTDQGGRQRST